MKFNFLIRTITTQIQYSGLQNISAPPAPISMAHQKYWLNLTASFFHNQEQNHAPDSFPNPQRFKSLLQISLKIIQVQTKKGVQRKCAVPPN